MGLSGELFFWAVDSVQMSKNPELCQSADQTVGDYLVKGHWTEARWRPVCKEEDDNWMEGYRPLLQVIRLLRGHELWADLQPAPPGSGGT